MNKGKKSEVKWLKEIELKNFQKQNEYLFYKKNSTIK